jgi:hypothetical protein
MTTSRVPQVIDYLVTLFQDAATLGQATSPVNVLDGPVVTADPGPLTLWVGVDDIDPSNTGPLAASSSQQWQPGLGRADRTETLSVYCTAQAWSGSDDVRVLRVAACAISAAAEDLVRADPSLGGTLPGVTDAVVTAGELRQGPELSGGRGMAARVTFTIDATAIIGT